VILLPHETSYFSLATLFKNSGHENTVLPAALYDSQKTAITDYATLKNISLHKTRKGEKNQSLQQKLKEIY
jgi:hypothetical protein